MKKTATKTEVRQRYVVLNRQTGKHARVEAVTSSEAHAANKEFEKTNSPLRYVSASKWFYPLQEVAEARFEKMYPGCERRCVFQISETDRVVEQWQVFIDTENPNERTKDVLVSMIAGSDTLLMYEMKFVASN